MIKVLCLSIGVMLCSMNCYALSDTWEVLDRLFNEHRFEEVITHCEAYLEEEPQTYELLWRLSRAYDRLSVSFDDDNEKKEMLEKASSVARLAIEQAPERFEGHVYLAASLGKMTDLVGAQEKVSYTHIIKEQAEKAIACNPDYYESYLILGAWHRSVMEANWIEKQAAKLLFGGLPAASWEEAERALKKAIALKPDDFESHYELGRVYYRTKQKGIALEALDQALACPVSSKREKALAVSVENLRNKVL